MRRLFCGICGLLLILLLRIPSAGQFTLVTMQNAAAATGNGTPLNLSGYNGASLQISGTFSATVTFEATFESDGTNWVAVQATPLATGTQSTTATTTGIYTILAAGATQVRARISTYASGSVTVKGIPAMGYVSRVGGGGAGGTVTSFSSGNLSPLFTASVATPTTTPALSFTLVNQAANIVYSGPSTGAAAAPTFRALVKADLPTATVYTDQANTFGAFLQKLQAGANFSFTDTTDTTKIIQFDLSGLTTATTRTFKWPDSSSSVVVAPTAGPITLTGSTAPRSVALPVDAAFTIARQDAGQTFIGAQIVSSNAASAFSVGPNADTNPVFRIVANVASAATGLSITGNAAASGVTLTALSSGANESIAINPKATGVLTTTSSVAGPGSPFQVTGSAAGLQTIKIASGGSIAQWGMNTSTDHATFINQQTSGTGINFAGYVWFTNNDTTLAKLKLSRNGSLILTSSQLYNWASSTDADGTSDTGLARNAAGIVEINNGTAGTFRDLQARNELLSGKVTNYNNIATAGWGVPAIYGSGRSTAQTAAVASVATYTVGAADGTFEVSANVLVTTSTTHNFTVTCAYTDEGNTARTITFTFSNVGGTLLTAIINTGGAVPYEGVPLHIRAKASTAITIATTGTFTSIVYNVEGIIRQLS